MALKKSEKLLIGYAMLGGGIILFAFLGWPQLDVLNTTNEQIHSLEQDFKDLSVQKESLQAQIKLLEKNTDIPPGIIIKTYTPLNKEQVIKEILDEVVGLATGAGNKFISLTPVEATPILQTPKADDSKDKSDDKSKSTDKSASDAASGDENADALPAPLLTTFGYELAIRGTYDTIQNFLKAMDKQKELLEIGEIKIENEVATDQAPGPDKIVDPQFPIRLTAKLRLAMQPVSQ
jgi:hypothetical protein